jgi:hypothetical protein
MAANQAHFASPLIKSLAHRRAEHRQHLVANGDPTIPA